MAKVELYRARAGMTQLDTICVNVFKHPVVHSMRPRETTEWGQPKETHEKQRNGKQMTTLLEHVAFQVFKNVSLMAA